VWGLLLAIHSDAMGNKEKIWMLHATLGKSLVLFASVLCLVMPWTEQHWTFDGFLHGHPDFELSLLGIITMFCLVLLLASLAEHNISILLSLRVWFCRAFKKVDLIARIPLRAFPCESIADSCPHPAHDSYTLPLRV
jgi:hypothetical protein